MIGPGTPRGGPTTGGLNILVWHVHAAWLTGLVQGSHRYLVPVTPDRGPDGRGRAETYPWPDSVVEVTPEQLRTQPLDVAVLQRPEELDLVTAWTGRVPGVDLPAVYVEHNTPRGDASTWRHPLADRDDIPLVHVTEFNAASWLNGRAPVRVIEHGVPDPGYRWTGERASLAVCINEPIRRATVAGLDVVAAVARSVPVEVYGMGLDGLADHVPVGLAAQHGDVPQARMHARMAQQRAYLHPYRWTSLGLSLIEAMSLGMPVLVLAATAAPQSVPDEAGLVSHDAAELAAFGRRLMADPELAGQLGRYARRYALERFGISRFLHDWDVLLKEVAP